VLRQNGIRADGESLAVLYSLNPGFAGKPIKTASPLVVPKATGGAELSEALKEGYLVALTLDEELKSEFLKVLRDFGASQTNCRTLRG